MMYIGFCQHPLKGHWHGYIYIKSGDKINMLENYEFDVYIEEKEAHNWKAITISKNNKSFYAKAYAEVDLNENNHQLKLTEVRLLKNQNLPDNQTCLMNCSFDLDFLKTNRRIKGDFFSNHFIDKKFCNEGVVFLEKQDDIVNWHDLEQESKQPLKDRHIVDNISEEPFKVSLHKKKPNPNSINKPNEILIAQNSLNIPNQNYKDTLRESPPCLIQQQTKRKYYKIVKYISAEIPQDSSHVH